MDTNMKPDIAVASLSRGNVEAMQGNLEAVMKSSQVWAEGCQSLMQAMAASAQSQIDHTMSAWKAMSSVTTLKEALELQTGLARATIENSVASMNKLTETSMKLSEQSFAPIKARVTLAVEKLTQTTH